MAIVGAAAFLITYKQIDFWIFEGSPTGQAEHRGNAVIGYTQVFGDTFLHIENYPSLKIVHAFLGASPFLSMYAVRPVYPFLVALLSPLRDCLLRCSL